MSSTTFSSVSDTKLNNSFRNSSRHRKKISKWFLGLKSDTAVSTFSFNALTLSRFMLCRHQNFFESFEFLSFNFVFDDVRYILYQLNCLQMNSMTKWRLKEKKSLNTGVYCTNGGRTMRTQICRASWKLKLLMNYQKTCSLLMTLRTAWLTLWEILYFIWGLRVY